VGGVQVRTVVGDKVPDLVWERVGRNNLWGVGVFAYGEWKVCDALPVHWSTGGSCKKGSETYSCVVPVCLLDPQENEFGVVMP
jgi:hypothetical protein